MADIICKDCGEPAKDHGSFGRFVPRWPEVLVRGSNGIYPIQVQEMEQVCPNTEAGLLRDALREKEEAKDSDLKVLARVVFELVPFIEKVRPSDDFDNEKYRFRWDDLITISRMAHD